ncbi:hypothetical protein [Couchioplanes caeruleus]|uniref:Uncharacterized protein n=2 Tax=Couchioplanes caeruleus TaxID=56438 RepID=A0A1K0GF14_9ACTN|nr:hypothetical protein [Couchioplanes caeruleus]OJF15842.1 hypothetical protein BG844_02370 [Couchioplanes caeruleus subsp. caeruleus]ROP33806.1 hypothetical protein EDD30_6848 [Couchioplanes caeruleus]
MGERRERLYGDEMQAPALDVDQCSEAARVATVIEQFDIDSKTESIHAELSALRATALSALRATSIDPAVLGDVLGDYLYRMVVGPSRDAVQYWPILELLRAAGADEKRAVAKAAWRCGQTADQRSKGPHRVNRLVNHRQHDGNAGRT